MTSITTQRRTRGETAGSAEEALDEVFADWSSADQPTLEKSYDSTLDIVGSSEGSDTKAARRIRIMRSAGLVIVALLLLSSVALFFASNSTNDVAVGDGVVTVDNQTQVTAGRATEAEVDREQHLPKDLPALVEDQTQVTAGRATEAEVDREQHLPKDLPALVEDQIQVTAGRATEAEVDREQHLPKDLPALVEDQTQVTAGRATEAEVDRDQHLSKDLPAPPDGFEWQICEEARLAILKPKDWFFKYEAIEGTHAFAISKENVDERGSFKTGLTVNYFTDVSQRTKLTASQYADLRAAAATKINELQGGPIEEVVRAPHGPIRWYIFRVRVAEPPEPLIIHHVLGADDGMDCLHHMIFESPEEEWEDAWQIGRVMLRFKTMYTVRRNRTSF